MNDNIVGPIIIGVLLLGLGGAMVVRYKEDSTVKNNRGGTRRNRNISRRK
jgi:hypothetical protein